MSPWELVLGTFLNLHELSSCGCSHLAVLCGCVSVFTGSGDACARAFNSRSGVLQKIFRGHKFIINCIQVRKGFLGGVSSFWLLSHLFCGNWLLCVSWIGCCSSIRLEYSVVLEKLFNNNKDKWNHITSLWGQPPVWNWGFFRSGWISSPKNWDRWTDAVWGTEWTPASRGPLHYKTPMINLCNALRGKEVPALCRQNNYSIVPQTLWGHGIPKQSEAAQWWYLTCILPGKSRSFCHWLKTES